LVSVEKSLIHPPETSQPYEKVPSKAADKNKVRSELDCTVFFIFWEFCKFESTLTRQGKILGALKLLKPAWVMCLNVSIPKIIGQKNETRNKLKKTFFVVVL